MRDGAEIITFAAFARRRAHKLSEQLEFPIHIIALLQTVIDTEAIARSGRHQVCVAEQRTDYQFSLQRTEYQLSCAPCEMRFHDKTSFPRYCPEGFHRYEPLCAIRSPGWGALLTLGQDKPVSPAYL